MSQKMNHSDLKKVIIAKSSGTEKEVSAFLSAFNTVFMQALQSDGALRINGLGTFNRKAVAARRSVNVATGETITIDAYNKLTFSPEAGFRESVAVEPIHEDVKKAISETIDPIRKIGEQANEILDIIGDLRAMDAEEPETPAQEEIKVPAEEERVVEDEVATEEAVIEKEETVEETIEEEVVAEEEVIIAEETKTEEPKIDEEPKVEEPKVEEKKKEKKEKKDGISHPWRTAFITILIFSLMLALIFLFVGYRFKVWVGEIHERVSSRPIQVVQVEKPKQVVAEEPQKVVVEEPVAKETVSDTNSLSFRMPSFRETLDTETIAPGTFLSVFARKHYGQQNTDLWVFIYEANKPVIRNPDCIKRGTDIVIPKLSSEWMDLNNPQTRFTVDSLLRKYEKERAKR